MGSEQPHLEGFEQACSWFTPDLPRWLAEFVSSVRVSTELPPGVTLVIQPPGEQVFGPPLGGREHGQAW